MEILAESGQIDKRFVSEKHFDPQGGYLSLPWGYIHAYYHEIQMSSSLKPLGELRPNFIGSLHRKGERKFI